MSCGDINYITNSKGVKCITVVLSDKQVVTIGSYVREVRAPNIPENNWKVHGIYQFQDSMAKNGKGVAVIGENRKNVSPCALGAVAGIVETSKNVSTGAVVGTV